MQEGCCTQCLFQNSLKKAAARPESQPQAKTMSAFFYCLKTGASTRLRNCVPLSEGSIVACGNFSDCKLLLNNHCIRYFTIWIKLWRKKKQKIRVQHLVQWFRIQIEETELFEFGWVSACIDWLAKKPKHSSLAKIFFIGICNWFSNFSRLQGYHLTQSITKLKLREKLENLTKKLEQHQRIKTMKTFIARRWAILYWICSSFPRTAFHAAPNLDAQKRAASRSVPRSSWRVLCT